jgi:hypothetical protein
MSTTTLDTPFAPQSLTLWDVVLAQVERVKRAMDAPALMSPQAERVLELGRRALVPLMAAADRAELEQELVRLARSGMLSKIVDVVPQAPTEFHQHHPDVFVEIFGPSPLARECARLWAGSHSILFAHSEELGVFTAPTPALPDLNEVLADFCVPEALRDAVSESFMGLIAILARVVAWVETDRWPLAPWQRLALLEHVHSGALAQLRLLGMVLDVPEELLPLEGRLDLAQLQAEEEARGLFVIDDELEVEEPYASALAELISGDSPAPDGLKDLLRG